MSSSAPRKSFPHKEVAPSALQPPARLRDKSQTRPPVLVTSRRDGQRDREKERQRMTQKTETDNKIREGESNTGDKRG